MFLSSIKIKNKIYTLTILASIFFILIFFITYRSFNILNENFSYLANTNESAKNYINLTYEIEKLKREVQNYTYTGYENAVIQAKDTYKKILDSLKNQKDTKKIDLDENVEAIEFHLKRYYENFLKVEKEKKTSELLKKNNTSNVLLIEKLLYSYAQNSESEFTKKEFLQLYILALEVEKGVSKYFETLNYKNIIRSKKLLKDINTKILDHINIQKDKKKINKLKTIQKQLEKYQSNFIKTTQHMRGYLSLVNVVMAAEAYEVIYHSDKINKKALDTIKTIEKTFNDKIDENRTNLAVISILFFMIMIILSLSIIKSIIKPLSLLTKTFNDLSSGKTDIKLPKYNTNDEMSELSNAANEFQKKSIETKKLLEKQEILTKDLYTKKEQLNIATQSAQIGIWTLDLENKKLNLDDIMYELYGLDKSFAIDNYAKWEKCIHKDDFNKVKNTLFQSIIEGKIIDIIFRIVKANTKEIRYIKSYAVITKDTQGKQKDIIGVNYDITEFEVLKNSLEKKVEEEVEKQREQEQVLIQQSKLASMGEMISAISHQWRQPLNAVSLYLQDLVSAQKYDELDEKYLKENVSKCKEQIEFMSNTIDGFRDFFNPKTLNENLDILEILRKSVKLFEAQLNNNFIKIQLNYEENESYELFGNSNHLKQSIANLLSNSIYAIKEKSDLDDEKNYAGQIDINLIKNKELIKIEVVDNGIGVSTKVQNRIFEPYFTTKKEGEGTGIGLYMTRTILEKYFNGKIYIIPMNNGVKANIELPFENKDYKSK